MNGVIVHVNGIKMTAVIACETGDHMVVGFKKLNQFITGDEVDTEGLWFGEHGEMMNKGSRRRIEVEVQCIVRDLESAKHACNDT
jgi:hypothetical protein